MMLVILLPLKRVELLENGLQPHSGVTPLFSMTTHCRVLTALILMLGVNGLLLPNEVMSQPGSEYIYYIYQSSREKVLILHNQ